MKRMKAFLIVALVSALLLAAPVTAAEEQETGSITGRISLPKQAPEWFDDGELSLDRLKVKLVGPMEFSIMDHFPKDRQKNAQETLKFMLEVKTTDKYPEVKKMWQEAQEARPAIDVELNEDGSFRYNDVMVGKWTLKVEFPRTVPGPTFRDKNWAEADAKFEVVSGEVADAGHLRLSLTNLLMPGDVAPDFTAKTYDGGEFKLSDFRGKYVVLDYWATWCGPCKAEIPNLEAIYKDFGGEKFEIIGLSLDNSIDLPKAFHEKSPSPYTQGFLGKSHQALRNYSIKSIPSIWLIGPDGKIIATGLRGEKLREAVQKALERDADAQKQAAAK